MKILNRLSAAFLTMSLPLLGFFPQPAHATDIDAVCRLQGAESLTVHGIGLVTGLGGTGDKANAVKVLMQKYLEVLRYDLSQDDLSTKNIALVSVSAEINPFARAGDRIQLRVNSTGDASSLKNGWLQQCNLSFYPGGEFVVRAEGRIGTGDSPTTGFVENGGQVLDANLINRRVVDSNGIFRLLLNRANYTDAATIAQNINSDPRTNPAKGTIYGFPDSTTQTQIVARARDAKEILVQIPEMFRKRQVEYISVVMNQLDIPIASEAAVEINQQTGIVLVTGNVQVMPGFISYRGRTVTLTQPPVIQGQPASPVTYNVNNDTPRPLVDVYGPYESGGAARRSLQSLVDTLAAMRCTTDDIIGILKLMQKKGMIQAKLNVE